MKTTATMLIGVAALSLAGCSTMNDDDTLERTATGAAIGGVAGAGAGAVIGGLSPVEGAVIGAGVGGLAGAVWSDRDNDGYADGYVQEGQYYSGRPAVRECRSVLGAGATGAGIGAVAGAGAGALIGGINPLEGALIGAAVGGIGNAVWADRNNDGCVDGYVREGQYYEGAPTVQQQNYGTYRAGERG